MLILFTFLATHFFELNENNLPMILFFDPLDRVECSVPPGYAWVAGWSDNLELEVDIRNNRGRMVTYGPYTNKDKVFGVAHNESSFTMRFYNNGDKKATIGINARQDLIFALVPMQDGYDPPTFEFIYYWNMSLNTDPIMYTNSKETLSYIKFTIFTVFLFIVNFIWCLCEMCSCIPKIKENYY
ncbi:hypothetical protein TRFO_26493 [Tritrichomonas foetus]|uniref:Uncharacterized protein n=1 Tax=Tritrichomonas foetus TaxID=1144522 RepID=A0A1J4K4H4_9EUKA|nr:hypothetical protein TRFO_26493 [Tritrichomonas foetus]|eukprot:OHT05744.1 hypothetical protein TRFO_26493 [Tritrichomonas foetus]